MKSMENMKSMEKILSNLYIQHWAWIYNLKTKTHMLYCLSQPGTPLHLWLQSMKPDADNSHKTLSFPCGTFFKKKSLGIFVILYLLKRFSFYGAHSTTIKCAVQIQ